MEIKNRYIDENLKIDKENKTITGTACVFNSLSLPLFDYSKKIVFREKINPNSANMDLLNDQDIIMTINHSENDIPLARSYKGQGTLKYTIDEIGIHFSFVLKNKDLGLLESIEAGDITKCSFQYWNKPENEVITVENGEEVREVMKIEQIFDFSIVTRPQYQDTEVKARQLQDIENEIREKILKEEKEKNDILLKEKKERDLNFINSLKNTFLI